MSSNRDIRRQPLRGRQEQQIFSARDVQKGDTRPGGYVTTGGQGGVT
jgi:hypothetical protein